MNLLEIKDLSIHYVTKEGTFKSVNHVNLELEEGETIGLVGETGAGKTTTALGILRLLQSPPAKIVSGEILFKGTDLLKVSEEELQRRREAFSPKTQNLTGYLKRYASMVSSGATGAIINQK